MSDTTGTEVISILTDLLLEALLGAAYAERRVLVNQYVGALRREKIANLDKVIGLVEEEQAKRAGLASSEDILAAVAGPGFETVQDADHLAYLLDVDEDEKAPAGENLTLTIDEAKALPEPEPSSYTVGQRVILTVLPHIGATVRSLDAVGVGLDYDTDDDDDRGTYEARYDSIRPMPLH